MSEKKLAIYIWNSVKDPKVDLENPKTKIEIFIVKGRAYCGLSVFENKEDFESRKSHLRPFPHPSSLHPKLARALINISGIKDGTLLDPFCGTGGFLIEAGLMNIKIIGYDISRTMVEGCKKNLEHFKIKACKIKNKNALSINDKFDYVVTDLPYGLNSNAYLQYNKNSIQDKSNKINLKNQQKNQIKALEKFYLKFLKNLRKRLKKKAVIIFPSYANCRKLLKTAKLKMEKSFSIHVHRSLARRIVLLRNR
ncbi:methyltransferase domain-containing protein [Candidatus Woesearchaeota archaeon]|nr:methyltransferase domain-containing protein [Candidatus Woesearchaeota archaeon]